MRFTSGLALLLLLAVCSCQNEYRVERRACYYWRTTLQLSPEERSFLRQHDVGRIYLRYFDVVTDGAGGSLPNATLSFEDSLPRGLEVVPVIYIHNNCMRQDATGLAVRIWKRVRQMNETNGIGPVNELQIDCDWTIQTRSRFFKLMEEFRQLCHSYGAKLSATIRLHQLSQPAPPVDRGVLMLYNTGDVTRLDVSKPILDIKDVKPYLHSLPHYPLELSAAYPLYTWHVLFRAGRYVGIMHGDDDLPVLPGDSIAVRQPSLDDILETEEAVEKVRPDINREVILYDLSKNNIGRFSLTDCERIFQNP